MQNRIWEKVFKNQTWGQYPAEPLIRFIAKNFYAKNRKRTKILELGCGPGANLWYLAREGFSFNGIDGSATAVMQAKVRLNKECPGWKKLGKIIKGDITKINFGEEIYDAIIDNECICCLDFVKAKQVYQKSLKALKTGGKIFSRTFSAEHFYLQKAQKISKGTYIFAQGSLAGKGPVRFTKIKEIKILFKNFKILKIEKHFQKSYKEGTNNAEWIIEGIKCNI